MDAQDNNAHHNIAAFEDLILQLLEAAPQGLSEQEIFAALRDLGMEGFERPAFQEPLALFQAHFIVFHTLYRLRRRLWQEQRSHLVINPVRTYLAAYDPGTPDLAEHDPLQAYYLDLRHLEETTGDEVAAMLDGFWGRLKADERRTEALQVLELEEPVDFDTIRRQYRRLAQRHHPDRGGDGEQLQAINRAMAVLTRAHGR